jgi:uroporphyrin-III C-methyltransferase/precorrin-2 dehydrogenase/sirohydrochlorin ferrochelatase
MRYLPVFAELKGRDCLVVGGGIVAERRARQLLSVEARVRVLAPELTETLADWSAAGRIEHEAARYADQPLSDYWLVVAATDDPAVNRRVATAAEAARRLCNVVDEPSLCSFIMPVIVDRDPVTIAISSSGTSPVVARWIKGLIEQLVPARIGDLAALAGRWRARVKAALPDLDERRHFWQAQLTGRTAEHVLAGREDAGEAALDAALTAWRGEAAAGKSVGEAYLVGAGPGDPELITLRGRYLLANADAVLYDRLVNPKILDYARRDAELISVGKQAGKPSIKQAQLNRLLVSLVASGKRVCRLKGGDPMIFGRAGEELEALTEAGLPFQIVPGVSAISGCAAYAGIPLTLRGASQAVLITTGHTQDHVAADLSTFRPGQTLALYMGVAHFDQVAEFLLAAGHDAGTPLAIVEAGTTPEQRVVLSVLADLPRVSREQSIASPALLLIGETVRCAERYSWFNPRVIGLTRTESATGLARVS